VICHGGAASPLRASRVRAVQLADAVVAEAGPRADGLRARLVAQETQCQFHAHPLAVVSIVADPHALLPQHLCGILGGINQI
jgi:hypothetical protein